MSEALADPPERQDAARAAGDPGDGAAATPAATPRGGWRRRALQAEAERDALVQQVRKLEEVREQLATFAADLNHTYLALRHHLSRLTALHDLSLHIGSLLDADAVAQATVEALQRLVSADTVYLFVQERGAYEIRLRVARAADGRRTAPPLPRHHGLVRDVMASGAALVERSADDQAATLVVPLRAQGRALGGACLIRAGGEPFRDEEVQLAGLCAATGAAALANAAMYQKSQQLALTDPLTGLYNRRSLEQLLEQELDKARRLHYPVGLLIIDVDRFKSFNDQWGHLQGDKVLGSVARAMRRALRRSDLLARFGGDEFVALLPGCQPTAVAAVGEKIRLAVAGLTLTALHGTRVTVSVGGTAAAGGAIDENALLAAADRALLLAKAEGRDRVVLELLGSEQRSAVASR